MQITNFGGNLSFRPKDHFVPANEQEVLSILEQCRGRRIRAVGRLHSWSEAAGEEDVVIDLRRLDGVRIQNRTDGTWATIEAGCQIKQVVAELEHQAGVTLPSLGLITEQTIAGAISTGTHGSGKHSLSHYIDEVVVATYDEATAAPILKTICSGPQLRAARCSLGCLGIILAIGVKCRSQYRVEEHIRMFSDIDDILAAEEAYPLQQFFLMPFAWNYLVQHRRETSNRRSVLALVYRVYWWLGIDIGLHLVLLLLVRLLGSPLLISLFYRLVAPWTVPRGWRIVDKSQHILTMEHELFRHIEIEVFVRRSRLKTALLFVRELLEYCRGIPDALSEPTRAELQRLGLLDSVSTMLGRYTHHYPICVRKVLPDDTLVSMASSNEEPYYALSFISYHSPRRRAGFFAFAEILAQSMAQLFSARPHWGKVCPIDADLVEQLYPHINEFREVCDAIDTGGSFRNRWLRHLLFAKFESESK